MGGRGAGDDVRGPRRVGRRLGAAAGRPPEPRSARYFRQNQPKTGGPTGSRGLWPAIVPFETDATDRRTPRRGRSRSICAKRGRRSTAITWRDWRGEGCFTKYSRRWSGCGDFTAAFGADLEMSRGAVASGSSTNCRKRRSASAKWRPCQRYGLALLIAAPARRGGRRSRRSPPASAAPSPNSHALYCQNIGHSAAGRVRKPMRQQRRLVGSEDRQPFHPTEALGHPRR